MDNVYIMTTIYAVATVIGFLALAYGITTNDDGEAKEDNQSEH